MNYFLMTDKAVTKELSDRLKSLRLRTNLSQREVAESTGLSITAVRGAETGKTTLITLVKILRALDSLDSLDSFLPELEISPLQIAKNEARKRKRATGQR